MFSLLTFWLNCYTYLYQTISKNKINSILKGKMGSHFVDPDYFLISFWPGDEPDENVTTIKTQSNFFTFEVN